MSDDNQEALHAARESGYTAGRYFSDTQRLREVLRSLAGLAPDEDPLVKLGRAVAQRREIVAALREVCEAYGDNDWPDDAYLPDVIEKHLGQHLDEKAEEAEDG
jgi:hypothetical protein